MGFGNVLKTLREKAGLSQAALAEQSGLSLRNIQNWEQGRRVPRMQVLPQLARAMGVSVNALVTGLVSEKLGDEPSAKRPGPHKPKVK
jgi:transcriptional regulator with XRE-family HTH domain